MRVSPFLILCRKSPARSQLHLNVDSASKVFHVQFGLDIQSLNPVVTICDRCKIFDGFRWGG